MRSKLKTLFSLQETDLRLKELENLRGDLPQQVEKTKQEMIDTGNRLQTTKQELKDAELEQKQLQTDIKQANAKQEKYKNQLYRVSTNREYDALTAEIEAVKENTDKFELRILKLDDIQEELQTKIQSLEEEKTKFTANHYALDKELQGKLNRSNREEDNLRLHRKELVGRLDRQMYSTYERVRKGKNGIAVVAIQRNACGGCFNAIPPQRLLEIREKEKFITCEFCGRILIWNEKENKK